MQETKNKKNEKIEQDPCRELDEKYKNQTDFTSYLENHIHQDDDTDILGPRLIITSYLHDAMTKGRGDEERECGGEGCFS